MLDQCAWLAGSWERGSRAPPPSHGLIAHNAPPPPPHHQGEAIAYNLREMFGLRVPIISVVIGEGGSGGALAIGCANRNLIMENSVYYVASPEACAAILWKSRNATQTVRRGVGVGLGLGRDLGLEKYVGLGAGWS